MANETTINIVKNFSKYPGGRTPADGDYSGSRFRDQLLVPALKKYANVVVEMDGTLGYGSSFLEEAFGGLVRLCGFTPVQLRQSLVLRTQSDVTPLIIWEYIDEAIPEIGTSQSAVAKMPVMA